MCGICGIFDAEGQGEAHAALVHRMSDALAHRGPDNDGFHTDAHCVLGHRRLRIIDLSPLGHQPMTNEDESLWISFNGEIYNYLELRPELVRRGHRFRSNSDTEVMLHLYEDEGEDFLKQLNGMFALSLWDRRRGRLLLATDRFGKKPIYWWSDGRRLLFASELKALLEDSAVARDMDPDSVAQYMALGYVPCPATIFRSVHKLPPASSLVVERGADGRIHLRGPQRYWSLEYRPNTALTETDCTARIREIVRDAVRIRMFSDVPLGAFLSGGLDSSTVVAAMAQVSARPVETFSIGFDEESFDEMPYAERVAKKFATHHHTFRCTPDALEVLPTLVHHFDEPFADSSAIPTYYVSKIARQHVTVALSGDGGDEVFAGYTRYSSGMAEERRRAGLLGPLWRAGCSLAAAAMPRTARGWGYFYRNSLPRIRAYAASMALFQSADLGALWSGDFSRQLSARPGAEQLYAAWAQQCSGGLQGGRSADALTEMQYVDQMLYLPDDILVKVDRASMAVALETRAPLLDYRLAEFMATVPAGLRFKGGVKKHLLKQAMRGILPSEIIDRSKKGFAVPLQKWFGGATGDFVRDTLGSRSLRERGIFDPAEIARLSAMHARDNKLTAAKIWAVLFFELWCRRWLDQAPARNGATSAPVEAACLAR